MFTFEKLQSHQINASNYINVTVEGYWSTPITIYVNRKIWSAKTASEWELGISNSSGGKEDGYDDLKASENFANAILECVKYCNQLKADTDWLERNFQENYLAKVREVEAEATRKQALVDSDPEVGVEAAKKLVKDFVSPDSKILMIHISDRGESIKTHSITRYYTPGGMIKGKMHGANYSRTDLVGIIAESSSSKLFVQYRPE